MFASAYNDYNNVFISATDLPNSSGRSRFNEGIEYGNKLIELIESGNINLSEGETIKIIGHSQGAAFAAGIATVLAKHQKYSSRIEVVHYISPHQPQDFKHPVNVLAFQWSTEKDDISSRNNFFWFLKGKSLYKQIEGVKHFYGRKDYSGGKHGHSVETWLHRIADKLYELGLPVKINGKSHNPPLEPDPDRNGPPASKFF